MDVNTNKIIYTAASNYFGNDTLVYEVCDNGFPVFCDTSITFITVLPVNDSPLSNADFGSVTEDDTLTGSSILLNDFDVDGDSLIPGNSAVSGPFHGTVTLAANGTYTYVPAANFNGSDYFIYSMCDNGIPQLCAQDSVFISITSVNDAPLAQNNSTHSIG